ncbi:aspartyl-phosphate phosphatase Spo0E family protein [Bacillus carboniphilus]|uniref:Aspartyl-phosphate phosphatase Spo0E family protein n=1 Tax=Bacillus carboniphilus TaxID=86663 RepID=A0ABY9JY61_9BACI|nr:aspartyl-phosphate phosphatase Spo0E family protein [Bacillus carboniphilus]WLR43453.1 aspartyl-phosphate phosphatase Spo0E family protein [Bacillus carboniphilus]
MSKQELLHLIEHKRAEMIHVVLKNGINSHTSLKYSQELDKLVTEYQKLAYKNEEQASYTT